MSVSSDLKDLRGMLHNCIVTLNQAQRLLESDPESQAHVTKVTVDIRKVTKELDRIFKEL